MKNKMKVIGNIYTYGVYGIQTTEGVQVYIGSGEINCCLGRHLHFLKRGLYANTNKAEMQRLYDLGVLEFYVIHESEQKDNYKTFTVAQREQLDEAMSVLEQFFISMYRDTIINSHNTVKRHSSNRDETTTIKRIKANKGKNNPNLKYSEKLISNILWLKENGYKRRDILQMLIERKIDDGISLEYISMLGKTKWVYLESKRPSWIEVLKNDLETHKIHSKKDYGDIVFPEFKSQII